MDSPQGLRELKKQRTRILISETALRLFAEHGFEAVSVSEIARNAEVSEATVFNYFPTKEDLVYAGMEKFEEEMLQAVRDRRSGESVVEAFGQFAFQIRGALASDDKDVVQSLIQVSRIIASSPLLHAREREILSRYADSLSLFIAEEIKAESGDMRPSVVAHALIGLHASLIALVRRELLEPSPDIRAIRRKVREQGEKALKLLEEGLEGYAPKQLKLNDHNLVE